MARSVDPGGPAPAGTGFTFDPSTGTVKQVYVDANGNPIDPAAIAASLAANPQASKGGYEGVGATYGTQTSILDAGAQDPSKSPAGDWSNFLGMYNLPADVQNRVNQIFANTPDVNQATALALAYIRGTGWYAQTYPGIQEGISRGVINNEADYRAYVNQAQQLNQQFYGQDITSQQIGDYLKAGYSLTHINQLFKGDAWVTANKGDVQYTQGNFGGAQLSNSDLQTLGQENAGLDSGLGLKLQNLVAASAQRMNQAFNGVVATPGLSLGNNGLSSPGLAGMKGTPDTGA